MAFGARSFGDRSFGDGAGAVPASDTDVDPADAAVTITATASIDISQDLDPVDVTVVVTTTATQTSEEPLRPARSTIVVRADATIPPRGTRRRIVAVDMEGSLYGELEAAVMGDITWSLNAPDEFSFVLSSRDPKAALVMVERFREIQVWRGDQLLSWGPIVRVQQDSSGALAFSCRDTMWYLGRRFIGKADRTDYFNNSSFEDGLAYWDVRHYSPAEPEVGRNPSYVQGTVSTIRAVTGRYSARLEVPNDTYPLFGSRILQSFFWEVPAAARDGDVWTVAAHVYIPSATLRSTEGAGLLLGRYSTTVFVPVYSTDGIYRGDFPQGIEQRITPIGPDFPLDKWTRIEVDMEQPVTGELENIVAGFLLPKGVMFIDEVTLTKNERLEFFAADQTSVIAKSIVEHLQDAAFDKSDLNIGTACQPSGVLRDISLLHSEHAAGLGTLDSLTKLDDGFDHRVEYTPSSRTYRTFFPATGTFRARAGLELGRNIGSYSWTFEGDSAASAVIVLGQGSGSDREEGFAEDTGIYANDLTLETVFSASPETPIANLDNIAAEHLTTVLRPEVLSVTSYPLTSPGASKLLGYIQVGDVVPVTIRDGELNLIGDRYRIIRMTLSADDTLTLDLNRREVNA